MFYMFFKDITGFFLFWVGVRISDWLDCCFDSWIDELKHLPLRIYGPRFAERKEAKM